MTQDLSNSSDLLFSFIFNQRPIRGVMVKLDQVIKTILAQRDYPPAIQTLLSEALVAVVLLFNLSKERGKITLQFQNNQNNSEQNNRTSFIQLLSVQCTHDCKLRALAQWTNLPPADLSFLELLGPDGKLVMTYQSESSMDRFQSIIPLTGDSLSDSMRAYFCQSDQLQTFLKISVSNQKNQADQKAAGILLQRMPDINTLENLENEDHFAHVSVLANTLTDQELLEDRPENLLYKLFNEDPILAFEPRALYFGCTCSIDKMRNAILLMGREESFKILDGADGKDSIEVLCEFCQCNYAFSRTEVEKLFKNN